MRALWRGLKILWVLLVTAMLVEVIYVNVKAVQFQSAMARLLAPVPLETPMTSDPLPASIVAASPTPAQRDCSDFMRLCQRVVDASAEIRELELRLKKTASTKADVDHVDEINKRMQADTVELGALKSQLPECIHPCASLMADQARRLELTIGRRHIDRDLGHAIVTYKNLTGHVVGSVAVECAATSSTGEAVATGVTLWYEPLSPNIVRTADVMIPLHGAHAATIDCQITDER